LHFFFFRAWRYLKEKCLGSVSAPCDFASVIC
jgi:hypothetical protein